MSFEQFAFKIRSPSLLRYLLSRSICFKSLLQLHGLLIANGLDQHETIVREAVDKYLFLGDPCSAASVYLSTKRPTLLLQNLILRSFSNHGYHAHLLSLYAASRSFGNERSDNFTFPVVIKACAALSRFRNGKEVHCAAVKSAYGDSLGIRTSLVDFYSKVGHMELSRKVFDEITERDLVSWNALISGYSFNGFNLEAFEALWEMLFAGFKPNGRTLVSIIPLCAQSVTPFLGGSLHALALKCGASAEEALAPTLISMYASLGDLPAARTLFDNQEEKDSVLWNSLISSYSQNGKPEEAFESFHLMHHEGERPDFITMVSVLSSCCDLSSISHGESLHAIIIKLGLADEISVVSSLVSTYAKLGELHVAEYLFQGAAEKKLILFNSMLHGHLLHGLPNMVVATFHAMLGEGVNPDSISIMAVISACAMCGCLQLGKSCHAHSMRTGFHSNMNVMNALLAFYSDCNLFQSTIDLFKTMEARNLVSWNTLLRGWVDLGDVELAVACFRQIAREGMRFDLISIISILPIFSNSEDINGGMPFHALAIKRGFDSDTSLRNALISMYGNCGHVEASLVLFDTMDFRSEVSWNSLMTAYRKFRSPREVMELFDRMKAEGQTLNTVVTLLNLLPCCETLIQGRSIHAFALGNFFDLDSSMLSSFVCMYARFRSMEYIHRLFGVMDKHNIVAWNTTMSVYAQSDDPKQVLNLFKQMLDSQVRPDTITFLALLSVCSLWSSTDLAQCVHCFAIQEGFFEKNTPVINSLIDVYARTGSLPAAKKLFDELQERDLISWSTMINAYGMHGDGEAALALFSMMQEEAGARPDGITFVAILSACSHSGLVEEGRRIFQSMAEKHRIVPRREHYACMVDLLSRGGNLDEALDLVRRLPCKPPVELLESLLGACQCYGDVEVGEAVGHLLLDLHPTPTSYVVLSNIFKAAKKWEVSGTLRFDMKAKAIRKVAGMSFFS